MSGQLELELFEPVVVPRLPPYVWEFHGFYYKGSSLWDLDLIEYKRTPEGKFIMTGWVMDHGKNHFAHPWNLHRQYRVNKGGERELITA